MAGERYMQLALVALRDFLSSNIGTQLSTIESEQSLGSGALPAPTFLLGPPVPDDNRSPLVEVFPLEGASVEERQRLYAFAIGVAISYSGDADLELSMLHFLSYHTAVLKTVQADYSLGGDVGTCIPGRCNFSARGDSAKTRFCVEQTFTIHIQDGS